MRLLVKNIGKIVGIETAGRLRLCGGEMDRLETLDDAWLLADDGRIIWDERVESRRAAKLSRPVCRTCRLLPLCGGGCSQKAVESGGENICLEGLSGEEMDKVVMQRFYDCHVR